jgi:hypothetical protein
MKDSRLSSKGLDRVTLPKKDLLHSHSTTTKGTGSRHFGTLMEKHTEDRKHYRVDLKDSLKKAEIPFFVKVPSSRHLSPARPGEKPSLLNHSTSLGSKTGITKRSSSLLANDYNPRKETKPSHSPKFTKKSLKHTHLDAHSIVASQKNLLLMKDKPEISRFSPQKRSQKKTPMRAQDTSPIQTISFRGNLSNESPSRQRQKQSEPGYQRDKFDHYLQQADQAIVKASNRRPSHRSLSKEQKEVGISDIVKDIVASTSARHDAADLHKKNVELKMQKDELLGKIYQNSTFTGHVPRKSTTPSRASYRNTDFSIENDKEPHKPRESLSKAEPPQIPIRYSSNDASYLHAEMSNSHKLNESLSSQQLMYSKNQNLLTMESTLGDLIGNGKANGSRSPFRRENYLEGRIESMEKYFDQREVARLQEALEAKSKDMQLILTHLEQEKIQNERKNN